MGARADPSTAIDYNPIIAVDRPRHPAMQTPFLIKAFIVLTLIAILGSLAVALVRLVQDRGRSERTAKALTLRIVMSIGLFIFLVIAVLLGLVVPHGVTP